MNRSSEYTRSTPGSVTGVFVTGTDTDAGKTVFAAALLTALRSRGVDAVGMKPVSAGCHRHDGQLRNADAEQLLRISQIDDYDLVNPFAYEPAIAPHIAAADCGEPIALSCIASAYQELSLRHDFVVVEGAGGWRVPLNERSDMSTIAQHLGLPVVLVVGLTLGCLNHALLSAEAIAADGCDLVAWAGSCVDPGFARADDNIATLRDRIAAPCIGILPHQPSCDPLALASAIDSTIIYAGAPANPSAGHGA